MRYLLILLFASAGTAQAQNAWSSSVLSSDRRGGKSGAVTQTPHNLASRIGDPSRPGGDIRDYRGQVCIYCHTPHRTASQNLPLWNRSSPAVVYTMYYPEGTKPGQLQPGPTSLSCLSCHDGTIALDNVRNQGEDVPLPSRGGRIRPEDDVGTDLSTSHPVGMPIPVREYYRTPAEATAAGVRLYTRPGGDGVARVECASCHDPHSTAYKFLSVPADADQLCLACHNM